MPQRPGEEPAAIHEVEDEVEELGDPEAGPSLPSATLAAAAAAGRNAERAAAVPRSGPGARSGALPGR